MGPLPGLAEPHTFRKLPKGRLFRTLLCCLQPHWQPRHERAGARPRQDGPTQGRARGGRPAVPQQAHRPGYPLGLANSRIPPNSGDGASAREKAPRLLFLRPKCARVSKACGVLKLALGLWDPSLCFALQCFQGQTSLVPWRAVSPEGGCGHPGSWRPDH